MLITCICTYTLTHTHTQEFFISKERAVQVRSGSRVGSSDFGVNAKRLNYIAKGLREGGWTIEDISPATHPVP